MKKSVAITTIIAIHAAVISVLLIQAGCSSEKEAQQPPKAETNVEEVTTISTGENSVSEAKENKVVEGSDNLRAAPTRPTGGESLQSEKIVENKIAEDNLNDDKGLAPITESKNDVVVQPKTDDSATTIYIVKKGDSISKIASKHGVSSSKLLALNSIKNANSIRIGQKLKVPAKSGEVNVPSADEVAPKPVSLGEDSATYIVKKGDSLSKIAYKNDMSVKQLMQVNGLKNANIRIGQKLVVKKSGAVAAAKKAENAPAKVAPANAEGEISHKVKAGEFLGLIASKYGVKVSAIKKRNNISDPRKIRAGQTIIIPAKAGAKAVTKPVEEKKDVVDSPKQEEKKPEVQAPVVEEKKPEVQAPVVVPEKQTTTQQNQQPKATETLEVTEL